MTNLLNQNKNKHKQKGVKIMLPNTKEWLELKTELATEQLRLLSKKSKEKKCKPIQLFLYSIVMYLFMRNER